MSQEEVTVNFFDEDHVALRQVGLGVQPMIIIEPTELDDGEPGFDISLSLIDLEDAATVLDILGHSLQAAVDSNTNQEEE